MALLFRRLPPPSPDSPSSASIFNAPIVSSATPALPPLSFPLLPCGSNMSRPHFWRFASSCSISHLSSPDFSRSSPISRSILFIAVKRQYLSSPFSPTPLAATMLTALATVLVVAVVTAAPLRRPPLLHLLLSPASPYFSPVTYHNVVVSSSSSPRPRTIVTTLLLPPTLAVASTIAAHPSIPQRRRLRFIAISLLNCGSTGDGSTSVFLFTRMASLPPLSSCEALLLCA
ncbi:hypothetical protein BHE74_00035075 [Ensete ventricosum]|nr:hypothetical protein BHE74_00035075 [Ensete ventricosum]